MQPPDSRPAVVSPAGPTVFEAAATLKNGLAVTIRHLRADDRDAIARAAAALDAETVYMRSFSYSHVTSVTIDRIMQVDPAHDVALVVVIGTPPMHRIIASGRLFEHEAKNDHRSGEVAFVVEEDFQGQGIAGLLLGHLIDIARARRLDALEADVQAGNRPKLRVFERAGLPMQTRADGASVHLRIALR